MTQENTVAAEDRGDAFTPTEEGAVVELSNEDLAAIGRAPDKTETAESAEEGKKEEPPEAKTEEKKDEKPAEKKPIMIPKARFDELNSKAKARISQLEASLKAAEARAQTVDAKPEPAELETQLDAKSDEYGKLIADGELATAKAVMQEINKINRKITLAETAALSNSHADETRHMSSLEDLVVMYKDAFPVFDDANDQYNQVYVDYVARLQGGLEAAGSSPAEALREAVEVAVVRFGLATEAEEEKPEPVKNKGDERKTAAVDKALKAAKAQPAPMAKTGQDSDKSGMAKIDVAGLTQSEFAALPESTLKRLRGDLV